MTNTRFALVLGATLLSLAACAPAAPSNDDAMMDDGEHMMDDGSMKKDDGAMMDDGSMKMEASGSVMMDGSL